MSIARSSCLVGVVALFAVSAVACGGQDKVARLPSSEATRESEPRGQSAQDVARDARVSKSAALSSQPGAPPPPQPGYVTPSPTTVAPIAKPAEETPGTEHYKDYGVNPLVETQKDRFSTFSIDVDTASYAISRRKINEGTLPPFASVRAEEFLNSFDYGYEAPSARDAVPFKVHMTAAPSPFTKDHHLLRVGVQAKRLSAEERMPVHLVYLVDVSGSMQPADRLPLAKRSLKMLTDTLGPRDTVALVTYAGDVRVVLNPTGTENKAGILKAIDSLGAGGGTSMGSGVQLAYDLAAKTLVKGHVNRVVVLSDGDANIGNTSHDQVLKSIAQYKDKGITLSTVGFGSGNYKDTMMEQLADKGDGNYTYIDSEDQARKVFGEEVDSLLQVVARDVKIQLELDPNVVRRYRLMGYENRDIADKDFRNDKVDAGEVGSGHAVTALYDVELIRTDASPVTLRLRHKPANNTLNGGSDGATESVFKMSTKDILPSFEQAPDNFRFASAVTGFAEILRHSPSAHEWRLADMERIAASATANRQERLELVSLVKKAERLSGGSVVGLAR